MKKQNLGKSSLQISPLCLGLSMGHNDFSEQGQQQFNQLINRALDLGLNFLDSSDAYWNGLHETWLGAAIGNRRDEAVITSKFGNLTLPDGKKATDARPEYVVSCCHDSLKRLNVDCIDLYYLHRVDPKVPIEDTVGAMSRMVEQGKVRFIGICEASPQTLERAHRVHAIAALQTEFSLWCREPYQHIIDTCRRLDIAFVGYSPLGRGLLTGSIQKFEDLGAHDRRRIHPRFKQENLDKNLNLVQQLADVAQSMGLTSAQLALAWAASQGSDTIPLTGTQRIQNVESSVQAMQKLLSKEQCAHLEAIFPTEAVAGTRYPQEMLSDLGI